MSGVIAGDEPVASPAWAQVPDRLSRSRRRPWPGSLLTAGRVLTMTVIAGAGPVQRVGWVAGTGAAVALAVVVVSCMAMLEARAHWSRLPWLAPVGLVMAAGWSLGSPQVAFWVGVGSVLAAWGAGRRLPVVATPPRIALVPLLILSVLAMARGRDNFTWSVPLGFAVTGTLAVLALTRWPDLPARVGSFVGRSLRAVLFGVLGMLTVVLPWSAQAVLPGFGASTPGGCGATPEP